MPRIEDRPQNHDHLGHASHRMVELGSEPLFDLWPNLGTKVEDEPDDTEQLVIVSL